MGTLVPFDRRLSDRTRRDEARIELLAALEEVEEFAIKGAPQLREWYGNLVRLGEYARQARAEVLGLEGGSNDAA